MSREKHVVELGSGIGLIAIAALKIGRVARLASYEVNPLLIPLIEKNTALNDVTFDIHNAMVLPKPPGDMNPFYIRRDFWASSLVPHPWGYVEKVEVPTLSFNEARDRYRPTMLIVDIEGSEKMLFQISNNNIFVELHQKVVRRVGMKNIFDFMSSKDHSRCGVVVFSHVLRRSGGARL